MQVKLPDGAELFYTVDDFTDPWTTPETVVMHHRRLDPEMVSPDYIRWYAAQMSATPASVVGGFQRNAGGDLRPLLGSVQTPVLILAAARLREEVLGDFRDAADYFPNGRRVVFPGVNGFVQHILPTPRARAWLDFARSL